MEPDADLVKKAKYENGYARRNGVLTGPVMGFTLSFVSMAIEGWGDAFRLPVWMLRGLVRDSAHLQVAA